MCELSKKLLSVVVLLQFFALPSQAGVIINATEVNGDIQFIGSGSIDLDSTFGTFTNQSSFAAYNGKVSSTSNVFLGIATGERDAYDISITSVSGSSSNGGVALTSLAGGGTFVSSNANQLLLEDGYLSNAAINFTGILNNRTFASIGLVSGDFARAEWSNSQTQVTEFVQINYLRTQDVPVPATLALFGLGLVGLGWSRRKKV